MYLCTRNYDLSRGGTFETAKAGTFHSVTAGTLIPLSANNSRNVIHNNLSPRKIGGSPKLTKKIFKEKTKTQKGSKLAKYNHRK